MAKIVYEYNCVCNMIFLLYSTNKLYIYNLVPKCIYYNNIIVFSWFVPNVLQYNRRLVQFVPLCMRHFVTYRCHEPYLLLEPAVDHWAFDETIVNDHLIYSCNRAHCVFGELLRTTTFYEYIRYFFGIALINILLLLSSQLKTRYT